MLSEVSQAVMLHLSSPIGLAITSVLGILCHRVHFIHGEHHQNARLYLSLWLIISILLFTIVYNVNIGGRGCDTCMNPYFLLFLLNGSFLGAMFSSIAVYRLFEHPLRHFSGPRLAAVSKLWHFSHVLRQSNHLFLDDIFHRYGTVVRTGPQELTIFDPAIWRQISGPGTSCIKGPWYDQLWPIVSISSIRTKEGYARRRKRWDEALGSVTGNEMRIHHYTSLLLRHIHASGNTPIDVTTWFQNLAFDVMGDFGFGKSFSFTDGLSSICKKHDITTLVAQGFSMLRLFTPIPWVTGILAYLAYSLPFVTRKWNRMLNWVAQICDAKIRESADFPEGHIIDRNDTNIFSQFIHSASLDGDWDSLDRLSLQGDALAITVAGSHTTSEILTMLFFELARLTDVQERLRKEVAAAGLTPGILRSGNLEEILSSLSLRKIPYLDACIDEAMRLYPAVPTGGIRQTVAKGFQLGNDWIPPNTVIVAPRWSIGRLESAFVQPNDFIPERWTTRPSMVKEPQALNAFGAGRHSCPGKQLGMMEVRIVAAMIVANFTFVLSSAEGSKTRVVDDFVDSFTGTPGKLELVFTPLSTGSPAE
ncbi:cytochrome P450 [Xylaria acuta]|nr:cytochrome P450 [Xylaria acuta]